MVSLFLLRKKATAANCRTLFRDSEESAPAEYPPDQPEADGLDDDSAAYGQEEVELEAALVQELQTAENTEPPKGEDQEMEGTGNQEEEISDGESEDIEDESDDDEDEIDEEEGGDADEDVEMGDDSEPKDDNTNPAAHHTQQEVMVH